jgi:hypothetical protein
VPGGRTNSAGTMDDRYRPLSTRRRVLILLLAVSTAIAVALTLLYPPGGAQRKRPPAPRPADCSPGQDAGCVGGKADVIVVVPAASPGSAAR